VTAITDASDPGPAKQSLVVSRWSLAKLVVGLWQNPSLVVAEAEAAAAGQAGGPSLRGHGLRVHSVEGVDTLFLLYAEAASLVAA